VPVFRVTKKLATALKVKLPTSPVEHENAEHEWFADLFYVDGKKCVIWVHRQTLLTFVKPAVVAAELREFHALFRYEFRTAVASMALPESLLDRFDVYGEQRYAPTNDRAIVGSMLDYRKMFALMVELDDRLGTADIRGINAQLCDTPMSVLGMESAVRVVRAMVGQAVTKIH
jgi:hypothetical protein